MNSLSSFNVTETWRRKRRTIRSEWTEVCFCRLKERDGDEEERRVGPNADVKLDDVYLSRWDWGTYERNVMKETVAKHEFIIITLLWRTRERDETFPSFHSRWAPWILGHRSKLSFGNVWIRLRSTDASVRFVLDKARRYHVVLVAKWFIIVAKNIRLKIGPTSTDKNVLN